MKIILKFLKSNEPKTYFCFRFINIQFIVSIQVISLTFVLFNFQLKFLVDIVKYKQYFKELFCDHLYSITYVCYQDRIQYLTCGKCGQKIIHGLDYNEENTF